MYQPKFKNTSVFGKISDNLFGTNFTASADYNNRMEHAKYQANLNYDLQKAVNINKYTWNKQGMMQAGINPLAASGNLSGVSGAPSINTGAYEQNQSSGELGEIVNMLRPSSVIKETKSLVKDILKALA